MAVFDKVEKVVRAPLAAAWTAGKGVPVAVGLDAQGRVVPGDGTSSGVIGIVLQHGPNAPAAGDIVDVMSRGEIVEMSGTLAGLRVTADTTTGALDDETAAAPSATKRVIGYCVEATRLIVDVPVTGFDAVV